MKRTYPSKRRSRPKIDRKRFNIRGEPLTIECPEVKHRNLSCHECDKILFMSELGSRCKRK